jgi:uncharacterized membrane protein
MPNFRITVDIEGPPDHVWAVLLDVDRWPEWTSTVTSVQRLDPGPLTLGSKVKILQPKLSPAVWKVTELDEAERIFIWEAHDLGVTVKGLHQVEETAHGSRATFSLKYSGLLGHMMARQLRDLNWEYITAEAQGLKKRCES